MAIIYGNNTVISSLEEKRVKKLYLLKNYDNKKILDLSKKLSVPIEYLEKGELDKIAKGANQGVAALVKDFDTVDLNSLILKGKKNEHSSLLVMLDELNDPHNFGAILRSSDAFGVDGIIYKKRGQVGLNETVAKVSTGAINYIPCCQVVNLSSAIMSLKKAGYWIIGLDGESNETLKSIPSDVPLCLVVGSEGYGISSLVKKNCDLLVKIPMMGHVSCLNASVACSIALYQIRN